MVGFASWLWLNSMTAVGTKQLLCHAQMKGRQPERPQSHREMPGTSVDALFLNEAVSRSVRHNCQTVLRVDVGTSG